MDHAVPFFVTRPSAQSRQRFRAAIEGIIQRGVFGEGPLTQELEAKLAAYTGAKEAVAVGNGSDALILSLQALGIGPGDEVLVPTFTFLASASAVVNVGATPVFVDVDPVSYNTTREFVQPRISPRAKAIMPVHLFAQMAPMRELSDLAKERGLTLVEDSAEGIGMRQGGVHAGLHGAVGVLSFFPTKTLGGVGDGGMVLTHDVELARRVRSMRSYGRHPQRSYEWEQGGMNSRLDELQAAILLDRLRDLDAAIARRRVIAGLYHEGLQGLHELTRPRVDAKLVDDPVYYVYLIECDRRDELRAHLERSGVGTETYYPKPLHLQRAFAHLGHRLGDFPNAERATKRTLALPLYPDLSDADAYRVVRLIHAFFGSRP